MVGLWDSVTGFFSDLGDFFSGKDFFETAGYAWNDMMKLAADVLTKNPSSGTYKDVWENISTIYTTLNVVAVSLLCIFFLYGFCRDSCDLHADLTFKRTIKMFIRLIITSNVISMVLSFTAYSRSDHNRMPGNEFGSAKWGEVREFNEKYAAKTADGEGDLSSENKVLSQYVRFRYDSDTLRNNNVFVVGGSGAGKTAFFLTPNLLSLHDCNIYTDPKGSLVEELGAWLSEQRDTRVYTLNLCEMEKSMHFNPFLYIRSRSDVTKLVTNLIQNTNSPNIKNSSADPFWERAERMFLESLFLYVWMECSKGVYNQRRGWAELLQKNWKTILYLLDEAQFVDADTPPKLDLRMEELAKKKPDHPAVKAYQRYRGGPDETIRSVIMTVNARMQPFDNEELLEIFSSNDIPLDEFGTGIDGDKKTKSNLFIIIPDDDDTFNFVPAWFTRCFFRSYTVRRGSLAESCRWMSVSGWMKWQISRQYFKIIWQCQHLGHNETPSN